MALKFEVIPAGSGKKEDIVITPDAATIAAGANDAEVKIESKADSAGEYKVKVTTSAADVKATGTEFTVKVSK